MLLQVCPEACKQDELKGADQSPIVRRCDVFFVMQANKKRITGHNRIGCQPQTLDTVLLAACRVLCSTSTPYKPGEKGASKSGFGTWQRPARQNLPRHQAGLPTWQGKRSIMTRK